MSEELKKLKSELAEVAKELAKVPKRLAFAKNWAQGASQGKAYRDAGYKSKKPHEDANKAIARYPNIAQYKELFLKVAQLESLPKEIATFEQKKKLLWEIAQAAAMLKLEMKGSEGEDGEPLLVFDAASARTSVSAVAELNKMDGHLAAIKSEIDLGAGKSLAELLAEVRSGGEK